MNAINPFRKSIQIASTLEQRHFKADELVRACALGNLPRTEVLGRVFHSGMCWGFALSIHGIDCVSSTGYESEEEAAFFLSGSITMARKNGYDAKLDPDCPYGFVQGSGEGSKDGAGHCSTDQKLGTVTC